MSSSINSKFLKVKCLKCKNEQVIFGKCTSEVKCLICGEILASPSGGKAKIKGKLVEVMS